MLLEPLGRRVGVHATALVEDADAFFEKLPRAIAAGEVSLRQLEDWPIFLEMRADSRMASQIRRLKRRGKKATTRKPRRRPAKA